MVAARSDRRIVSSSPLSGVELRRRAANLKFVLTDCDGVLTDTGVYYSHNGEELRRFSVRDGMGVQRLRECGIETAIISKENSLAIRKRSEKLAMRQVYLGVTNKLALLPDILAQNEFELANLAYIGDDVNDLEIIEEIGRAGLSAAPVDAMEGLQSVVHFVTKAPAGHGAFRDFAEWIIRLRTGGEQDRQ